MLSDRAVSAIAIAITSTWVFLQILDPILAGYSTPAAVHGIMGLVAGALFGERSVRKAIKKRNGVEH